MQSNIKSGGFEILLNTWWKYCFAMKCERIYVIDNISFRLSFFRVSFKVFTKYCFTQGLYYVYYSKISRTSELHEIFTYQPIT